MRIIQHYLVGLALVIAAFVALPVEVAGSAEPQVKQIAMMVEEAGGVNRTDWPVTQGVPFAEGDFPVGAAARVVLEDGTAIPTQTLSLTTWSKERKFVKWLLVDFQIDLKANQRRQVYLEYGQGVEPVKSEKAVAVIRDRDPRGEILRIDTGVMQLDLQFERANFFDGLRVKTEDGWRELIGDGTYLYMTDDKGRSYRSDYCLDVPEITVEDSGPLRVKCLHSRPTCI